MKRPLFLFLTIVACDPSLAVPETAPAPDASAPPITTASPPIVDGGADADAAIDAAAPDAGPAHAIDGTNDFTSGETFVTTSPQYNGYVTYDASTVYFGMTGADVNSASNTKWVLIYVDGVPASGGTTTGQTYGSGAGAQTPTLPFNAGYHLRWKADDTYTDLQQWNGTAWVDAGLVSTFAHQGTFFEVSVPRATFGNPTRLKVNMFMLNEQSGAEWTYAGTPAGSFTDGKGANVAPKSSAKWLDLDLGDHTTPPNAFPVKP